MKEAGGEEIAPLLGIIGWSGAGKTTLLEQLIPILRRRGLTVSAIKHTHHQVDLDRPGKDSYRLRQAGAQEIILAGRERFALLHENTEASEEPPPLYDLAARFAAVDVILVEGFRHENFPKLEVHRPILGKPLFAPQDASILAVITDEPDLVARGHDLASRPILPLHQLESIADFVLAWWQKEQRSEMRKDF